MQNRRDFLKTAAFAAIGSGLSLQGAFAGEKAPVSFAINQLGLGAKMKLRFFPYELKLKHVFTVATYSRTTTPDVQVEIEYDGVIGYGDVGKGCARFGRALGGKVSVVELDPVRALQALMDGFTVASLSEVAARAGMLISATGEPSTIPLSALEALPENAIVTVAGGVVGEVEFEQALAAGWTLNEAGPAHIQHLRDPNGKSLRLLEKGEGINYTAGEGNPIEIMDMSFGVQVAALTELLTREEEVSPGLHNLPQHADDAVSRAALDALRGTGNAQ